MSFKRFRGYHIQFNYQGVIEWAALFDGNRALMPKIREVILCALPVDWTPAAADDKKQPLRGWSNPWTILLATSPTLEVLEVGGYYLFPGDSHTQAQLPLVHLPALKHSVFGWTPGLGSSDPSRPWISMSGSKKSA